MDCSPRRQGNTSSESPERQPLPWTVCRDIVPERLEHSVPVSGTLGLRDETFQAEMVPANKHTLCQGDDDGETVTAINEWCVPIANMGFGFQSAPRFKVAHANYANSVLLAGLPPCPCIME